MNIILFTKYRARSYSVHLDQPRAYLAVSFALLVAAVLILYAGFRWGASTVMHPQANDSVPVQAAEVTVGDQINALSLRIAQMQAQAIRIDALGYRLTKMAGLDEGEFDFEQAPGVGGVESNVTAEPQALPGLLAALDALSLQMDDREDQLGVLKGMLFRRNLQAAARPAGAPTAEGWISSHYGMRTDPFNGHREFHSGIDFAGRAGSEVVAVASGVVTWAGERDGYGRLVEINHGNGFVTRYGHNRQILVNSGDSVAPGEPIALMGSTGRSTGPHVHFEVLKDGKPVNPLAYIRAAR